MKKISIVTLAMLILFSCTKEDTELNSMHPAEGSTTAKSGRPISIKFNSEVNPASPLLSCTLPGVPFAIANSGYFLHGHATHLGLINAETSIGLDGSCHLDPATFILATTTAGDIVSANGDKITYTGVDAIDLNNIIFSGGTTAAITGVWTITGGTGRFAEASGSFTINGLVDVTTAGGPTFTITGDGIIFY